MNMINYEKIFNVSVIKLLYNEFLLSIRKALIVRKLVKHAFNYFDKNFYIVVH